MKPAQQLQRAYEKSGLTAESFFEHVCTTRDVVKSDSSTLSFKVEVPAYDFDLEWFGFNQTTQQWEEL